MRIMLLSYWMCPLIKLGREKAGGMSVYIFNLAKTLAQFGHTIDIYTRNHQEEDERTEELPSRVNFIHLSPSNLRSAQDINSFSSNLEDFLRLKGIKYDILHAHYFYSGLVALRLKKKFFLPTIFTFHTLGIAKQRYADILDEQRIKKEKEIAKKVDCIIAATFWEKDDLVKFYQAERKKIHVVPPGVDLALFQKLNKDKARKIVGLPQKDKIILFVGRTDPVKGIKNLFQAFYLFLHRDIRNFSSKENVRLVIIGGEKEQFFRQAQNKSFLSPFYEKKLNSYVHFWGRLPYRELPYYYSAADIVVVPSSYESFSLVTLEAMACGVCVIVSDKVGARFLIKDGVNGRVFPEEKIERLAEIMKEMLTNDYWRQKIGEKASNLSQKFSWEKQAQRILAIYKRCL